MKQPTRFIAIAVFAITCVLAGRPALAGYFNAAGPETPDPNPSAERRAGFTALSMEMFRERNAARAPQLAALRQANGATAGGSLGLLGEIACDWTSVDGYVTYTQNYTHLRLGFLQILLRGYETTRDGTSNRYRADWDRRIYWLNFDGDGPGIPYLMGSLEFFSERQSSALD